jgi:hypothetical protein
MLDFDLDGEITPAMLGQIRIVYGGSQDDGRLRQVLAITPPLAATLPCCNS